MLITDYSEVYTFTQNAGDTDNIKGSLSTFGYVQPNEALAYSSPDQVPAIGGLVGASTEPAVYYSHSLAMRRVEQGQ